MAQNAGAIKLLSSLLREVKYQPLKEYISTQFRTHQVTSKRVCRSEEELRHLGSSYLCLLQSTKQLESLMKIYSKGERSVEDTAALVGLQLPQRKR